MSYFFITGLPRSRTAWLANFFTHGPAFCWHDHSRAHPSARALRNFYLRERQLQTQTHFFGNSDSALLLFTADMLEEFPDAHWILIKRDSRACEKSFLDWFTAERPYPGAPTDPAHLARVFTLLEKKFTEAEEILPASRTARISFDDLKHETTMRQLWDWCVPGTSFPLERWKMLETFQLNVMAEKLKGAV